ncbi:hypothetical protein QTP86_027718, partial [Hemibagrus guttatus]
MLEQLLYAQEYHIISALVDSGGAINLINHHLVEELRLPTLPCGTPLRVTAVDNRPIRKSFITRQTIPMTLQVGLFHTEELKETFINQVFKDLIDKYVITYINDILIYLAIYDDYLHHVCTMLTQLLHHQLYVKAEKCEFHKDTITFLGYVISWRGVDSSK